MRNTLQHPITLDEIHECLTQLADEISAQNEADASCGDMRPTLLRKAADIIDEQRFAEYLASDNTIWGALYRKHSVKTFDEARRVAEQFSRKAREDRQPMVFGPKSGGKASLVNLIASAFMRLPKS